MAFERQIPAVASRAFTSNGGAQGQVTIADTRGFKVGLQAVIKAIGQNDLRVQIKRVLSETSLIVGPIGSTYGKTDYVNLSAYTVAAAAYIYADQQEKSKIPQADRDQAAYDQEPTVAYRTVLVDELGRYYGSSNPIPIAFDGTVTVGNVTIQDDDGDELSINSDGSINVNIVSSLIDSQIYNEYGEVSAVPNGVETIVVQYIVPLLFSGAMLQRISVSGENIARFQVFVNDVLTDTRRTYFGSNLNETFEFAMGSSDGIKLDPGDTVKVKVIHNRPQVGDFEGRIQILQIA